MLGHMSEPLIDLHITGPAGKKNEALSALRDLGYKEAPSWRDAFPSDIRGNEGGVCLKIERKRKRMTQKELSHMTGIPQPHISEMERGKRPIGKKIAGLLAKAMRVDYRVFL